jgi:hypothetical protein
MPDDQKPQRPIAPPAEPKAPKAPPAQPEYGGRDGPDPVRYGDWEKGGIAVDF